MGLCVRLGLSLSEFRCKGRGFVRDDACELIDSFFAPLFFFANFAAAEGEGLSGFSRFVWKAGVISFGFDHQPSPEQSSENNDCRKASGAITNDTESDTECYLYSAYASISPQRPVRYPQVRT